MPYKYTIFFNVFNVQLTARKMNTSARVLILLGFVTIMAFLAQGESQFEREQREQRERAERERLERERNQNNFNNRGRNEHDGWGNGGYDREERYDNIEHRVYRWNAREHRWE